MIEIWSKYNCIFCDKAEKLCQIKGLEYKKYMLGVDYSREDLIKNEQSEIEVINQYLPRQKSEDETEAIVDKLIKIHNLENLKDMGKLMGFVKKDYPGEVDMGLVGKIAKSKLGN